MAYQRDSEGQRPGHAEREIRSSGSPSASCIENWAVWRDATLWDRFRTVWHPEGQMWATWFQGTYEEFIKANQEGFAKGVRILHFLGGSSIDLALDNKPNAARHRADQDDDQPARDGAWRRGRRAVHRPLLRFPREARRQVGPRAAPALLREGPDGPGRSRRDAEARSAAARTSSRSATATSPICRRRSATRSRRTCRASSAPTPTRSTPRARAGSKASRRF